MKWEKKGLIYCPEKDQEWKNQFAMTPTPLLLGDVLRVYVGICDKNNVGRIGFVDVKPDCPHKIIKVSDRPVLDIGEKGCFDDNGVVPVSIREKDGKIFLYYIGFQLGVKVPYYMFCGLAISDDYGESFYRYSKTPVLDRCGEELFARCGCNVLEDDGKYKMWYIGSYKKGWITSHGKKKPLYMMRYTESSDGMKWDGESIQCMKFQNEDEHGFGRPYVWKEAGQYKMLYCVRTYSRGYYIGYAVSKDGIKWERKDDEAGIDLADVGWDSNNLSYPYIYRYLNETYMFYNGNDCGKSGFGYAKLIYG